MLNAKLLECYKALYDRADKALRELCDREGSSLARDRFMAPHLIGFSDEAAVETADLRVMFFGQETAVWKGASLEETVENYVCFYNDFREYANLPESCWQNYKSQFDFWTAMRKMRDAVVSAVPTGKVSFIWNNICKITAPNTNLQLKYNLKADR